MHMFNLAIVPSIEQQAVQQRECHVCNSCVIYSALIISLIETKYRSRVVYPYELAE